MVCKIYVIDLSEENQYAPRKENPSEARDLLVYYYPEIAPTKFHGGKDAA